MLIICVPEDCGQQALDELFNREQLKHRPKMRLLKHPLAKWEDPPKTIAPRRHGLDFAPVVVREN